MCIRDSVHAAVLLLELLDAARGVHELLLARVERVRGRADPVSYTHLTLPTIYSV